MRVAWASDLHLDAADDDVAAGFLDALHRSRARALLIGGDLAESDTLVPWLERIARAFHGPVYFVLGNHEYYLGSIESVESLAGSLEIAGVEWLGDGRTVALTERTALVGRGGWGDAGYHHLGNPPVILADYLMIEDLRDLLPREDLLADPPRVDRLLPRLGELGRAHAEDLASALEVAVTGFREILVLTHVPPFVEVAQRGHVLRPEGGLGGFTCRATGEVLKRAAEQYSSWNFTVLCGHTHREARALILPNLEVRVAPARYGAPRFFELDIE